MVCDIKRENLGSSDFKVTFQYLKVKCTLCLLRCPAPSAVPTVHLMRSTSDTLSLSWLPPEKPNGVILDYEIKYHERVSSDFLAVALM